MGKDVICVLKFTDKETKYVWSEVSTFGDADQVLFVSRYYCFFVASDEFPGCQLRDCIVFSDDAFPRYSESKSKPGWNYESKVGKGVAIYSIGGQGSSCSIPVEFYPGFPVMWSPPPWILHASSSPLQSQSHSHCELEDVEMLQQSDSDKEDNQVEEFADSDKEDNQVEEFADFDIEDNQVEESADNQLEESESERMEQTTNIISTNAAGAQATSSPVVNDIEHVAEEVLEIENLSDTNVQTHCMDMECLVQTSVKKIVTVKFQGLDVEFDHLPVLQNIWMKHGDIVEGSVIPSFDTRAMALTSLAKMVLILQTNCGKTLTDDLAHYLDSTLSDLQCMHLKVDWLAPFVEKALAMHKSKPLQTILVELEKAKTKVEEMEQKFLLEIAEMKKKIDRDIKFVSESLPMNPDKCLGEELC